ncbi:uncharacterized protein EAF01_005583 [Botrytis porri]|uniref:Uncharacterized protein n=1 Tax=Botrytis porri TaxID=87229 RepID=A0A4Z1KP56_9HELO|nr:uncharacterized protein EAF01_005583 [Botrytis porri]KAF7905062.1 hypothetical protein EAF01_005583 [Botrytis porri]TGO85464.1 hypothetical protein BPOR_0394g00090 [Botrytis porri]
MSSNSSLLLPIAAHGPRVTTSLVHPFVLPTSNHPKRRGSIGTNTLWLGRFDSSLAPYIKREVPCSPELQALPSPTKSSDPDFYFYVISAKHQDFFRKDMRVPPCLNVEKS